MVRGNRSPHMQLEVRFQSLRVDCKSAQLLAKCKSFSLRPGMAMVKVVMHDLNGSSMTRYPDRPRGSLPWQRRIPPKQSFANTVQVGIELTGCFETITLLVPTLMSLCRRFVSRLPDSISQRLGRSAATLSAHRVMCSPNFMTLLSSHDLDFSYTRIHDIHIRAESAVHVVLWSNQVYGWVVEFVEQRFPLFGLGMTEMSLILDYLCVGIWRKRHLVDIVRFTMYKCSVYAHLINEFQALATERVAKFLDLASWAKQHMRQSVVCDRSHQSGLDFAILQKQGVKGHEKLQSSIENDVNFNRMRGYLFEYFKSFILSEEFMTPDGVARWKSGLQNVAHYYRMNDEMIVDMDDE